MPTLQVDCKKASLLQRIERLFYKLVSYSIAGFVITSALLTPST